MSPEKAALLDALTAERYRNTWWVTPTEDPDTEEACEERRRAMDDDFRGRED